MARGRSSRRSRSQSGRDRVPTRRVPRAVWNALDGAYPNPGLRTVHVGRDSRFGDVAVSRNHVFRSRLALRRALRVVSPNVPRPRIPFAGEVQRGFRVVGAAHQAVTDPRQFVVCQARKVRRRVLAALNVVGRRGLGGPSYTEDSKLKCGG